MSSVHLPRRRVAARAGLVSLAAVAASSLGLSAASAAPALDIPLDPQELFIVPVPVENFGATDLLGESGPGTGELQPVAAQQAGTVEVDLPTGLDGTDATVSLGLAPSLQAAPTKTYSSEDATSPLLVTADAEGDLTVVLPADASNGPIGSLTVDGIATDEEGVQVTPLQYAIELFAAGDPEADSTAQLSPQLYAGSTVPCPITSATPCPAYAAQAGSTITLSVPTGSLLPAFGLGTLENLQVVLTGVDADGAPTGDSVELTGGEQLAAAATEAPADEPAAAELAQAQELAAGIGETLDAGTPLPVAAATSGAEPTATVTLPADLAAGSYALDVVEGNSTVGVSVTSALLTVEAAPAAPAAAATTPPVQQNAGLVSDTGWIEPTPAEDGGPSMLVLVGGGTLLAATGGIVTVLRTRRRGAGS